MKTRRRHTQLALFPADRAVPEHAQGHGVQVRLDAMELHRPRQWGACWLACQLYEQLGLDRFWASRLPDSREGTCWRHILQTLVCLSADRSGQRVAAASAVVRAERDGGSARRGLCAGGEECALSLPGQAAGAQARRCSVICASAGRTCSGARFECLLYDLTSTYFESRRRMTKRTSAATATAATSAATACRW